MRSVILAIAVVGLIAGTASAQNNPSAPPTAQTAPAARPDAGPAAGATANTAAIATEAQAKAKIESSGFANVTGLSKDSAGIWHGKAMKDGMMVNIALDAQGNVKTE